jgi:Uma2 family endonuclease
VVQPDLLFVASGREPSSGDQAFSGAPDLIVEVLSPSTTRTDRVVKFSAYERAGVREYWLVNPLARLVEVYALSEDDASEDDASEVYELHGEFISGSTVTSQVLPGLTFHVDDLFPSQ